MDTTRRTDNMSSQRILKQSESLPRHQREPTLEAVLNSSSQLRLNLPTILPTIKRSISKRIKLLPVNDKHSPLRETSRLEHAVPTVKPAKRYADQLEELNEDIHRFEEICKNEKQEQPLYFHGHIIRK